jgi:hypothetical protein
VARADGQGTAPIGTLSDGTPVYQRPLGFGFFLVVEAAPGPSGRPVGTQTFNANGLPNLQIVVSRPLGNGSPAVCDSSGANIGGVPAVDPPMFGGSQASTNAINDLGCRFDARTADVACTHDASDLPAFLGKRTTVQFCPSVDIGAEIAFPLGDTRVTARVTDVIGQPGLPASIIIRVTPP